MRQLDVLNIVSPEPRANQPDIIWMVVSPEAMFQNTFEHMIERLSYPPPDDALRDSFMRLKAVLLNRRHRDMLAMENAPSKLNQLDLMIRAEILESLRLYFTETLHQQFPGQRIGLHITDDVRYRY